MPISLQDRLRDAERMLEEAQATGRDETFTDKLKSASIAGHIEDLRQQIEREQGSRLSEILEFRISGPRFTFGTIPLESLAEVAADIRRIFGYVALRVVEGTQKKRVPPSVYSTLNLRLSGLATGSTRLIVSADSEKMLFSESLARESAQRIFSVFRFDPANAEFLESVSDVGPIAARRLKRLVSAMVDMNLELGIEWISRGTISGEFSSNRNRLARLVRALNTTTISQEEEITMTGKVELLSARNRLQLRMSDGTLVRISYPTRLLDGVSALTIGREIRVRVLRTVATYTLTGETASFFELVSIDSANASSAQT